MKDGGIDFFAAICNIKATSFKDLKQLNKTGAAPEN